MCASTDSCMVCMCLLVTSKRWEKRCLLHEQRWDRENFLRFFFCLGQKRTMVYVYLLYRFIQPQNRIQHEYRIIVDRINILSLIYMRKKNERECLLWRTNNNKEIAPPTRFYKITWFSLFDLIWYNLFFDFFLFVLSFSSWEYFIHFRLVFRASRPY